MRPVPSEGRKRLWETHATVLEIQWARADVRQSDSGREKSGNKKTQKKTTEEVAKDMKCRSNPGETNRSGGGLDSLGNAGTHGLGLNRSTLEAENEPEPVEEWEVAILGFEKTREDVRRALAVLKKRAPHMANMLPNMHFAGTIHML